MNLHNCRGVGLDLRKNVGVIKKICFYWIGKSGIVLKDPVDIPFPRFQCRGQRHLRGTGV